MDKKYAKLSDDSVHTHQAHDQHSHDHSSNKVAVKSVCCGTGDISLTVEPKKSASCCNATNEHAVKTDSCCSSANQKASSETCCSSEKSENTHCCSAEPLHFEQLAASEKQGEYLKTSIRIMQMDCPTEEGLIQKKLGNMPPVKSLDFNLMQRVLTVVHEPEALSSIVKAIQELGFEPELANTDGQFATPAVEKQKPIWIFVLAGVFALAAECGDWFDLPTWFTLATSVVAIALAGIETYKKGLIAVKNLNLNINALMSIAVTGALLIGHWPEAAMVMVLFALAELIEAKSLARARNAIGQLMQLAPNQVTVLDPSGQWQSVDATNVSIGQTVRVKPGEKIGLDGLISKGQSTINQAPITGESIPVEKFEGDLVYAGTINQAGSFEYRVTAAANDTTLARIIHAVEEAQGEKAPTQRFVDRFAKVYTPIVFAFAILIAVIPPLFMGGAWLDWIYKALVILVIACPCALVISTPVTVVSGLAAAARKGILIKGGVYLEEGRLLKYLAFDKTGTITHGKPKLTDLIVLENTQAEVEPLLLSLASRSDHPVSQAIVQASTGQEVLDVNEFTALAGRGTRGEIAGVTYWLGNHRLIHELNYCSPELEAQITELEKQGKTVVLFAKDQHVLAIAAAADTVKESSRQAIQELHQLGVKTLMLSGDNVHTVNVIAQQVGIDDAKGSFLPEDKLNLVASYAETSSIGMVGDGINDAPALARANIGFAMGTMGTDVAIETADVALMDDDLRKIPSFIRLSQKTHQILLQNIGLALITKLVFLIITLMNLGTMWMAVFADVGVSLLVVANGLRLLRK
ncbi:heavy metal translocating P-type ATPase [Acinetobacter gerneri]|uniref:P-type Zn(2+) transporter n=1 Tax=Acinetobacter gerneri DSM 14967 = CIP 107464 = MTCC 9824 TaxID=1120926 RepID=N8ZL32_9GAMM|nr:heavy metal translocating P-type ATPase [Acinetobacter gerneri]ENV32463.1 copper-translocating P-type ATPase [Acinetobacter gerneri DSM 14967 = CIP 107464 = MTCC 9824]EPR82621.1 Lead, cadmium, zinc and mercury transporting ATPase [Acinetobacter gerneri DSM 14967 = CIP 107464 = MTCC 9824]MDV2441298.1 heavy metal translocating P-type ATPase [Acinetobacter gerneri]